MNIADVIKLSVGGYTKDQIKEMGNMTKESPELLDYAVKNGKSFDDVKELFDFSKELNGNGAPPPDPKPEPTPDNGGSDHAAELKQKIAELQKQNDELSSLIKQVQSANLHTDNGGNPPEDPMKLFGEIVATYM